YVPKDAQILEAKALKDFIQPYKENSFIRNLVHSYAAKFPAKVLQLQASKFNPAIESPHPMVFF
ncbi:MAG: hypothetical protein M3O67_03095, partial [Bacteroidota bacterium]|nr:hypothetical protein [Bacteroidota bacterium]